MPAIILETASSQPHVILADRKKVIESFSFEKGQLVVSAIDQLLKKYAIAPSELSYVACGIGPGSFTGLRLSATCIQSLSYALTIPLITFLSLQAFTPPRKEGVFFSVILSGSTLYYLEGKKEKDTVTFSSTPTLTAPPAFHFLISPDAVAIRKRFSLACEPVSVDALFLASYTYTKFQEKQFASIPIDICYLKNL